ncbi:Pre-mRNA-processing ATP-dependent RNA helicase PRP5 [Debaryomyces fabryi]|uniref:RNA helicase n=1 Tax=Debaryomyces fabryi TaxID=58627 RepID=A0A0V1Q028_9ASCO|nr:Pre-mRNA-processing ATP-dependent RNA helicase PRP5 [Debaryomyces fabryi]KSA01857.1 Pre-mRNA-processing ATP-dependent RNA helicase PRP5 [Debaryomyces fabryi]CUM45613.1 unnamed protein product [Debaryomyces fabryi]
MNSNNSGYSLKHNNTQDNNHNSEDSVTNKTGELDKLHVKDNQVLSKEEKLKRRQEQLAAWKQKRQHENQEPPSQKDVTPVPDISDIDQKKLIRQQRIEEWKRKRLQKTDNSDIGQSGIKAFEAKNDSQHTIKINASMKKTTNDRLKKRLIFGEEEEDDDEKDSKPKFKKPSLDSAEIDDSNDTDEKMVDSEIDELDKYLLLLEEKEKGDLGNRRAEYDNINDAKAEDLELVNVNESDDEEIDEDQRQQDILSSKLKKLQNKQKQLDDVDHSEIKYKPFRKDFYTEPIEILKLSQEEVANLRIRLDGIKVRGVNCTRPILRWSQLGLPSTMMSIIEGKLNYSAPSSIQAQAIPAIMSGRDIIGVAKTGSGKTLSFVLPLLRHIQDQPPLRKGDGPIGLIMTPTRELALQIHKELSHFTKKLNISSCCCFGGSSIESQIAELKKGAQIIVGTPGRIIDLLAANSGRVTNLQRVTYLVLDEADRMFDMGFEPQVTKVFTRVRPDRQTVLFSATFPRKMELLAKKILDNPMEIVVGGISVVASEITQKVELFENETEESLEKDKFSKLLNILKEYGEKDAECKILIFVEKQNAADELLVKLLTEKYACLAIHGGKDQIDRKYAIREFSSSNSGVNILIATSIAARGLDVKGLNLVINYEAANHMEDYVHRVGRTGRAGRKGTAITFVSSKQGRAVTDLVKAMRLSKVPDDEIDPRLIEISTKFLEGVKSGKEKFNFGFSGKGLDNLQEIRENNRDLERKVYGEETDSPAFKVNEKKKNKNDSYEADLDVKLPDFHIIEGRAPETAGPDKCKFHSRITINDLPQKARWITVNRDSLSKVIETTGTSITNKGHYYPPNSKIPKTVKQNGKEVVPPPKLYLLVEGLTEKAVHDAIMLLRQKMIEGLEVAAKEESKGPTGKYTV